MQRSILMSICIGAVALTGACSRNDTNTQADTSANRNIVDLATHPNASISAVTVDGCLSASGNRFMLASLDKDASKTTVYQLVNADDQLRNMLGKEVRVSGQAEATQAAESREVTPPAATATSGSRDAGAAATSGHHDDTSNAKVGTVTDTKLDVQKLTVASVTPTGDSCPR